MKVRRRVLGLLLSLVLLLTLVPVTPVETAEAAGYMKSGDLSMPKLSREEIAELTYLPDVKEPLNPFSTRPGIKEPFSLGAANWETTQNGLQLLNALRRLAGLPPVVLDTHYTTLAQAAAVVNAAAYGGIDYMSHSPSYTKGMPDDLYAMGCEGAAQSNLHRSIQVNTSGILARSVYRYMDDSDISNVARVGHRRWQLNPKMGKTGFGVAAYRYEGDSYYGTDVDEFFSAEYAFDESGPGCDYDFIAWPASGNFPTSKFLFNKDVAWSVSLNPDKYKVPSIDSVVVTLKRESDGKVWTFSGKESYSARDSGLYFNVDTSRIGVPNCIIFRPDIQESYASSGLFTATVTGIKTAGGKDTSISYQVDFFDVTAYWDAIEAGQAPATAPTTPETPATPTLDPDLPFTDIPANAWYRDFAKAVYKAGLMGGSGDKFNPAGTLSVAEAVTLAARMHASANGAEVPAGTGAWYQGAVDYVLRNGLVDPAFYSVLEDMTRPATRYEMAALLDRAVPASRWTNAVPDPQIPDVREADEPYGAIVYRWYRAGIVSGGSDGSFNGESNITRAEVAKILCLLNGLA